MKPNAGNVSKINSGFTLISHRLTAATASPRGSLEYDKLKFEEEFYYEKMHHFLCGRV